MRDERKRTIFLGLAFLILLAISSVANTVFFNVTDEIFLNHFLAVGMLFVHNILVISLILLGMTFYVNLVVSDFFRREKHANILLEHPRTFALVFTIVVLFLSILRGISLLGGVRVEDLPLILLICVPMGLIEGYGIYLTIKMTLSRAISMRHLAYIYGIFLIAAVMEVGFINLLIWIAAG